MKKLSNKHNLPILQSDEATLDDIRNSKTSKWVSADKVHEYVLSNKDIKTIEQAEHGFIVNDIITKEEGNPYSKARADTTSPIIGIITKVIDADNVEYATEGDSIPILDGTNELDKLYLSNSYGIVTTVKPVIGPVIQVGYNTGDRTVLKFNVEEQEIVGMESMLNSDNVGTIAILGDSISHGKGLMKAVDDSWSRIVSKAIQGAVNQEDYGFETIQTYPLDRKLIHDVEMTGSWTYEVGNSPNGRVYSSNVVGDKINIRVPAKWKYFVINVCPDNDFVATVTVNGNTVKNYDMVDTDLDITASTKPYDEERAMRLVSDSNGMCDIEITVVSGNVRINGIIYKNNNEAITTHIFAQSTRTIKDMSDTMIDEVVSDSNAIIFALGLNDAGFIGANRAATLDKLTYFMNTARENKKRVLILDFLFDFEPDHWLKIAFRKENESSYRHDYIDMHAVLAENETGTFVTDDVSTSEMFIDSKHPRKTLHRRIAYLVMDKLKIHPNDNLWKDDAEITVHGHKVKNKSLLTGYPRDHHLLTGFVARRDTTSTSPGVVDNSKWYVINDNSHVPMGLDTSKGDVPNTKQGGIGVVNGGYDLQVHYFGETLNTFIATPDETFAKKGVMIGNSTAFDFANLSISAPCDFSFDLSTDSLEVLDESVWGPKYKDGVLNPEFKITKNDNGSIKIYHPSTSANVGYVPNVEYYGAVSSQSNYRIVQKTDTGRNLTFFLVGQNEGIVSYDGTNWVASDLECHEPSDISFSFNNGLLRVTFPQTYSVSNTGAMIQNMINTSTDDFFYYRLRRTTTTYFEVFIYDSAGVKVTAPSSQMKFGFSTGFNGRVSKGKMTGTIKVGIARARVKASEMDNSASNWWMFGVTGQDK